MECRGWLGNGLLILCSAVLWLSLAGCGSPRRAAPPAPSSSSLTFRSESIPLDIGETGTVRISIKPIGRSVTLDVDKIRTALLDTKLPASDDGNIDQCSIEIQDPGRYVLVVETSGR